ncbi:MAG: family 10 glycosylhydrolase [Clostridia bacterium]|nr:family 10 glycosylhydrolase [Clostridia bacterium]
MIQDGFFRKIPYSMIFCICVLCLLSGCQTKGHTAQTVAKDAEIRGVWVSYSEVKTLLKDGEWKKNCSALFENCNSLGITDIFLHVRAFCDAIYPSRYYPLTPEAAVYDYDVLDYFLTQAHEEHLRVHGWLNPYRVRLGTTDWRQLPAESPARKWLSDDDPANDDAVCFWEGIYLNPAVDSVRQLILNGVRELLKNYPLDGIHVDDYFYPTTDATFDEISYQRYCGESNQPLSLEDWRRANVNALISGCYTAVKFSGKDLIFSVSPAADLENNLTDLYADVIAWCQSGCVDWMIPQLYFGFDYPMEKFRFDNLLKMWQEAVKDTPVTLLIGLAPYKIGTTAAADRDEWTAGSSDLLARQITAVRQTTAKGYLFFSYASLFSGQERNAAEREEIKNLLGVS